MPLHYKVLSYEVILFDIARNDCSSTIDFIEVSDLEWLLSAPYVQSTCTILSTSKVAVSIPVEKENLYIVWVLFITLPYLREHVKYAGEYYSVKDLVPCFLPY